jgi:hypothetical protein
LIGAVYSIRLLVVSTSPPNISFLLFSVKITAAHPPGPGLPIQDPSVFFLIMKIKIYTDGSCIGNPGPGGWAAVILTENSKKEIFGGEVETTNNRME